MDFGLSEVQQMLKSSAREFLAQECPRSLVRRMEQSATGCSEELWRQAAALGWIGLALPEEHGGSGGSFLDLAVLLEEMGYALLPVSFFASVVLGGLTVAETGNAQQKQDLLLKLAGGHLKLTLAVTEATATWEPWGIEATAKRQGDNYVIQGTKLFVPDAHIADYIIVAARAGRGPDPAFGLTLFLVPAGSAGLSVRLLNSIASDRQCEVVLDGVTVPASAVLGVASYAAPALRHALLRAAAAQCLLMAGGAQAVLDITTEYARQRAQFGRPIGSFQAIQHFCANMATEVESARLLAYQASWKVSSGEPADLEVSTAKAFIGAAYERVCQTAHQCHGAIGFTREHDLQLYTRRAKAQQLNYGDSHFHKEVALSHIERS